MTDQTLGATTETPAAGAVDTSLPSASEIMAFDPFAPAKEPAVDPAAPPAKPADDKGTQSPPTGTGTPLKASEKPPADPKAPPASDPNAPPVPPVTPPAVNYEQLIRDQTAAITEALAPKEPDKGPAQPKYNLALPPQVLGLLRSEDPGEFATGMHAVINGISNKLWQDFDARIAEFRDKIMQDVPQLLSQQHETITTQERVATDFYGKHPTLNNPLLKPLIQSVGMQVAQARQAAGKSVAWGDELRDEIAESIFTQLPQLRPTGTAPPAPKVAPKLPFVAGSNSRPGNAPDPTSEFTELLN